MKSISQSEPIFLSSERQLGAVTVPRVPVSDRGLFEEKAKRLFDVLSVLLGLVPLAPLLIVLAQTRIGRGGRPFRFYKFRSMVTNAESLKPSLMGQNEKDGPIFKIQHDPRITPVGRVLRKYSIDELPQLLNVLKGEDRARPCRRKCCSTSLGSCAVFP